METLALDVLDEVSNYLDLKTDVNLCSTCSLLNSNLRNKQNHRIQPYKDLYNEKNKCLQIAIDRCDIPNISFFVEKGADLKFGLHRAARNGNLKLTKYFFDKCEKPFEIEKKVFVAAGLSGDIGTAKYLIHVAHTKCQPDCYSPLYTSILKGAVKNNHSELIELFLDLADTGTVLCYAASFGNLPLVKRLFGQCGDFRVKAEATSEAFRSAHMKIIEFLQPIVNLNWNAALCSSVYSRNMDLINLCIQNGADDWNEGLTCAVIDDNLELIKFFFEKGGQIHNELFMFCLDSEDPKEEILEFLLRNGGDAKYFYKLMQDDPEDREYALNLLKKMGFQFEDFITETNDGNC